jgi:hypothetical protein
MSLAVSFPWVRLERALAVICGSRHGCRKMGALSSA